MFSILQRSFFACLLVLLSATAGAQGLQLEHPLISFNAEGITAYDATLNQFSVVAVPLAIQETPNGVPSFIEQPAELTLTIEVDENGVLIDGAGPNVLITGTIGGSLQTLLEGEVVQFMVANSAGPTDIYELVFEVTGGTMEPAYAGGNAGIELTSEQSTFDGTFAADFFGNAKGTVGRVVTAASCNLTLDKTCLVVTPASGDFACTSKIVAARFRYIGLGFDDFLSVEIVGSSGATASYNMVELVQNETVLTGQNGFSIDATVSGEDDLGSKTSIFINGVEEVLHTSCSAPFVAGQPAPLNDPKGDPSPNWLVEAFIDKDGNDVSLPDPNFSDSCEIPALGNTVCDDRPSALQFRYTGGDCSASSNSQPADKFDCDDFGSTAGPVDIRIFNGSTTYTNATGVTTGSLVDAANGGDDFDSEVHVEISDASGNILQTLRFHTSCSQTLAIGDSFGGLELVSFTNDDQGTVQNGAEVIYRYTVSNLGTVVATDVHVTDTGLNPAEVPGSPIATLGAGITEVLEATAFVTAATSGTAMLSATVDGQICEDSDSTPITIATPPPCTVASDGFELKDDAFKWDLSNTGIDAATIASISISWPAEFGALKEIKLEGDKIMDNDLNPPSATIDTFLGNLDKRQIEAGKTDTLEFKFDDKYKDAQPGDFVITVTFAEGCEITFEAGMNAFGDCDGKIRELTLIWDGMVEPVNIRAYAGAPGSTLVTTSGDLFIGQAVTAGDFTAAGAPNDVYFEVFDSAGNVLGESKFHRSCSDDEMDGPEDCGMPQGNGKGNDSGFINDWLLQGMQDDNSTLDCG